MIKKPFIILYLWCLVLLYISVTSCYIHTKVQSINTENIKESKSFDTQSPTKAHLADGSLIVFENGLQIKNRTLTGTGVRYDLTRQNRSPFSDVTMDSVVCLKYYKKGYQVYPSLMSNPLLIFMIGDIIYESTNEWENE